MSRPYIQTLAASVTGLTLSLDLEYLKLRGNPGGTFTVTGVSSSAVSFTVTESNNYDIVYKVIVGNLNGAITPGAVLLGGSPSQYLYNGVVTYTTNGGPLTQFDTFTFSK